eukprot:5136715-Alexandrium_andersonii.AAC.1
MRILSVRERLSMNAPLGIRRAHGGFERSLRGITRMHQVNIEVPDDVPIGRQWREGCKGQRRFALVLRRGVR